MITEERLIELARKAAQIVVRANDGPYMPVISTPLVAGVFAALVADERNRVDEPVGEPRQVGPQFGTTYTTEGA